MLATVEVFDGSLSDLAWAPGGYVLAATSLDGTLAVLHFDVRALSQQRLLRLQ